MNCARCGGLMTYERFYSSPDHFWGWRCISCGEILDQIILQNRGMFGNDENQRFTKEKKGNQKKGVRFE